MSRLFAAVAMMLMLSLPGLAQDAGTKEDHDALRQLLQTSLEAVNTRDYAKAQAILADPFSTTVTTQDHFTSFADLKAYFESLYTRDMLRMKTIKLEAAADAQSQIYTGTYAVATGSTSEFYELADGRAFDMKGRWTAVTAKQADGSWKLVALHMGTNFLDNPVLSAIEGKLVSMSVGGLVIGLLAGFMAGWFLRRRPRVQA
jgi:ketosteroid isomerase-like protein